MQNDRDDKGQVRTAWERPTLVRMDAADAEMNPGFPFPDMMAQTMMNS